MFDRIRYNLKKPGNRRVSFAIVKDVIKPDNRRRTATVKDERIDALNKLYADGVKSAAVVEIELRAIIAEWQKADERRKGAIVYNDDNRRILEDHWDRVYKDKDIVSHSSAKNRLYRAIEALGPLSIASADRDVLQKTINRRFKGNAQRDRVAALNQLLRASGRNLKLHPGKRERRSIRHLTPSEFARVYEAVEIPIYRAFFAACFATGGRTGEVFAMGKPEVHDGVVFIETQLDREEMDRDTKNGRKRHTVLNSEWAAQVDDWLDIPPSERAVIRNEKHCDVLRTACKKVFGSNEAKWCTVKDLRHSYAIWLLTQGVSIGLVAQSLGNSQAVCQEYYAGFVLAPDSIQAIKSILKSAPVVK